MHKVLFLSHFFPPYRSVQSKINLSTAYVMMDYGWDPIVITSEVPEDVVDRSMLNIIGDLIIYRYCSPQFNKYIDNLRSKLGFPLTRTVFAGIESRMYEMADKALKDFKISLIYSISSVGDTHEVGMRLAEKYHIPWVAEFQDPWLENQTLMSWVNDFMNRFYLHYWKKKIVSTLKKILERADLIVTETEGHCTALRNRARNWNLDENKIMFAYLGSDQRVIDKIGDPIIYKMIENVSVPKIGFVGNLYYGYEKRARSLIKCLRKLELEGVSFCFITVGCDELSQIASDEGLNSILPISRVPFREAIGIMRVLDLGVTIPSSNININSKLFDYLQQGCRVLVWGCSDGEMASLVKEHNCGIVLDDSDEERATHELCNYITESNNNSRFDSEDNGWFTRREFFKSVLEQIS